jgi:mono/diheme cytochrome c family protein
MTPRRCLLLSCVALALASCGGGDDSGATGGGTTTGQGTTTGTGEVSGEQVFTSNCGTCHTLGAAGTSGEIGPNLDDLKPNAATVKAKVQSGGGGMPSFEDRLSDAEIDAVSNYVAENAGKSG